MSLMLTKESCIEELRPPLLSSDLDSGWLKAEAQSRRSLENVYCPILDYVYIMHVIDHVI